MQQLLAHSAIDVNLLDDCGESVLSKVVAARRQSAEILQCLLGLCDINSQNNDGETALFIAARAGNEHTVQQLLAHDAIDVNLANAKGETPFTIAAREGHAKVVRQLLEYRPDIDIYSGLASHPASPAPPRHSSLPPIFAVLLGNSDDKDKITIAQEITKYLIKPNIRSTYHDWGRDLVLTALISPIVSEENPGLLGSLFAMVTQSDITEAILLGIRDGMLVSSHLTKLLEASPNKVAIRKDIMIAAAQQLTVIPTRKPISTREVGPQTIDLIRLLIASLNTTFDLDTYLYISREWPESTSKFRQMGVKVS